MWIEFDELPEHSRVWIYQSDRDLDDDTSGEVLSMLKNFIDTWEAHGSPLKGAAKILYNRFLIIGLDESFNAVTGCSTDASVHAVKAAGDRFNIDFFNRTQLPFLIGDKVEMLPLDRIRKKEVANVLNPETITINTLVKVKGDLESAWKQPVAETWLAKYVC